MGRLEFFSYVSYVSPIKYFASKPTPLKENFGFHFG
jgi:hypothetical protein